MAAGGIGFVCCIIFSIFQYLDAPLPVKIVLSILGFFFAVICAQDISVLMIAAVVLALYGICSLFDASVSVKILVCGLSAVVMYVAYIFAIIHEKQNASKKK